jgi:hypothetical protein
VNLLSPKEIRMTLDKLARWTGVLAGLFIGVPGAVEAVTGETAATSFVLGIAPALALPLLTALYLRQGGDRSGAFGTVAYTVNVVGLGLFGGAAFTLNLVLFYVDQPVLGGPTRLALLGSAVVFAVGAALFGISMVRARIHPKIPAVAYAVALPVLALAAPLPDSLLTSAIHVAAGASITWLAAALRTTRETAVTFPAHRTIKEV